MGIKGLRENQNGRMRAVGWGRQMLKPMYKLQIGQETIEPVVGPIRGNIIYINVELSMDSPVDHVEILFGGLNGTKFSKGDSVSVSLGYVNDLTGVFKGNLDLIKPNITGVKLTGLSSMANLLALRIDKVYGEQSAGNIISDIASQASISLGAAQDGMQFPTYMVDSRRSAYDHMKDLTEKCGFNMYVDSDNKLIFKKFEKGSPHTFQYAKDIIDLKVFDLGEPDGQVEVYGESPSGFIADTTHWLTKKQVKGVAGSGNLLLRIQDPSLKTPDMAKTVAEAKFNDLKRRAQTGKLKTVGAPMVKLGDTIEIKGTPNLKINDVPFQVRSIKHWLSKSEGFISVIGWSRIVD